MNLNSCDDWGWYVDIENADISNQYNYNISNNKNKNIGHYLNKIETIQEIDIEDLSFYNNEINKKNINIKSYIYKVGSTTIITGLLTYFILFII
jgi:hypothetical protein